ncbi:Ni/Fe hydrogenase subunit alpha [Trebonia kvetii]|uniref:Ni/Fe hydrogenase subunit alpha n=1 Tax=Trebonia kvetii TaxID=2480626 RepID=A0A6P2C2Y7_9ACTN|nr:Ni/Fe hydrogenase subunit alpha [Trebonia kvetii]TVZ05327.1 Ni/Fe hydrogenase subunit alpha [Trebonia kvetii]
MTHHIKVPALARVEGEGGLEIVTADGQVTEVRLDIFEPPRFFEGLLRGRQYTEPPDITARICGICPVAYQMSACRAIEDACGVTVPEPVNALRRLLYCGEWIESHVLHIYLLHAPDFLGYESGIHLARDHPEIVQRGLRMKKAGNRLLEVIGGRSVHPVNVRVGGFYRAPDASDLRGLAGELEWARQAALDTVAWVSAFDFPDFSRDYEYVSLRDGAGYPIMGDRIVSSRGLDIPARDYDSNFTEFQVPHSTALHSVLDGNRTYLTGPLARYRMNSALLPEAAASAARAAGLDGTCDNPFRSIIVRAVELVFACDEALRLIEDYEPPEPPSIEVPAAAATGYGCTEAPRGMLYHRYRIAADGTIADAKIVPPTSQNLRVIEADLREFAGPRLGMPRDELTLQCEQAVRSHDPCISCAAHFLDLRVVNRTG